jgi:hypothetical protein
MSAIYSTSPSNAECSKPEETERMTSKRAGMATRPEEEQKQKKCGLNKDATMSDTIREQKGSP